MDNMYIYIHMFTHVPTCRRAGVVSKLRVGAPLKSSDFGVEFVRFKLG